MRSSFGFCFLKNKLSRFFVCILFIPVSVFAISESNNDLVIGDAPASLLTSDSSVITVLNKMAESVLKTDYQIYFVTQEASESPNSFRYSYLVGSDGKGSANLLHLEGAPKEIISRNNIVSYFQPDSVSFSISASRIIEAFPDVVYNDFNELAEYYDFVLLGKARAADRSSQVIRIIPKDKDRYNYVIWIDDVSHLPLRIDLLDLDSRIIKQMKVLALNLDFDKEQFQNYIEKHDYPILFPIDKENSELNKWEVTWLPKGFKETAAYNINFYDADIDTRLFSDGMFSFTINVSEQSTEKATYVVMQGVRAVYSTNLDNMNIVIIGNLPVETIEQIASNIKPK